MSRSWKPGDVARVTYKNLDEVGLVRVRKSSLDQTLEIVYLSGGVEVLSDEVATHARPFVVIDPDDTTQIQALAEATGAGIDATRAALRRLLTPPVPEPTGLGAVVEDTAGNTWVRINGTDWYSDASPDDKQTWAQIAADITTVLQSGIGR